MRSDFYGRFSTVTRAAASAIAQPVLAGVVRIEIAAIGKIAQIARAETTATAPVSIAAATGIGKQIAQSTGQLATKAAPVVPIPIVVASAAATAAVITAGTVASAVTRTTHIVYL